MKAPHAINLFALFLYCVTTAVLIQAVPPSPPVTTVRRITSIPVQTNAYGVAVTLTGQYSTDLSNWVTVGSMTFSQAFSNGQSGFWRGTLTTAPFVPPPLVSVTTYRYDNSRAGVNANERILSPVNVNTNSFARLYSYPLDNWAYAQPLYVAGVNGHNLAYAATLSNTVYAIDVDGGALIWSTNLGPPVTVQAWTNDFPTLGILGTPVIDLSRGLLYAVSWTLPAVYSLHAINITNGADRNVAIAATTNESFNGFQFIQRSALTLVSNRVIVPWACASADGAPSCIMSFDADSLQQTGVWNTGGGGIWMAGAGPASDGTNLYFSVGNDDSTNTPPTSYANSVVKLNAASLAFVDFFCPSNTVWLSTNDVDLGSGGVTLLPNGELAACGKEGTMFVLSCTNLGGFNTTNQDLYQFGMGGGMWSSPAFFNGLIYCQGDHTPMQTFALCTNRLTASSSWASLYPPPTPAISASGTNYAICWTVQSDTFYVGDGTYDAPESTNAVAVLRANDAYSLAELWNSKMSGSDDPGGPVKFSVPVVVNGKVIVAGQRSLAVYGIKPK